MHFVITYYSILNLRNWNGWRRAFSLSLTLISLTIIIIIFLCFYLESDKLVNCGIDYNVVADQPNDAVSSDVSIRKLIKLETNEVSGFCFAPLDLRSVVKLSMFQFHEYFYWKKYQDQRSYCIFIFIYVDM